MDRFFVAFCSASNFTLLRRFCQSAFISFERHFHFWRNYLVSASLAPFNFRMFCMIFEKDIRKFFTVIIYSIIVNREQDWGEKYWSWIILKGKKLHLNVFKRIGKNNETSSSLQLTSTEVECVATELKSVESSFHHIKFFKMTSLSRGMEIEYTEKFFV